MQKLVVFVATLLCVLRPGACSDKLGNPWHTKLAIKSNSNMVQTHGDAADVGATDQQTDEEVVTMAFGDKAVNLISVKEFVRSRGFYDVGLLSDLISRAACIVRLEATIGSELNEAGVTSYLDARQRLTSGSKDELLDRSCDYQSKELAVRRHTNILVKDIKVDTLSQELKNLGFLATSGTKSDLVFRLGQAVIDLDTIRSLSGDSGYDTSSLKDSLTDSGLSTEGTLGSQLTRYASYLMDVTSNAAMPGISSHCDVVLASSLCVDGGKKVIAPRAVPRGLVGHWTFDDAHSSDHSGLSNHAVQPVAAGPGLNGVGASAAFDGKAHLQIPHSKHLDSQDFCVTSWVYLLADATGTWRTLLHKGNKDRERTPTLFMEPLTRGIEFFVSTTDTAQPAGERLWSNSFVPLRKWTHLAACAEGRTLRLFINGLLDAENTTIGTPILNQGPMYVGNDPWRGEGGGLHAYVDELRYYTRFLSPDDIQAEAQLGLGGVEPAFVELGCMGCTLDNCPRSCRRGFHQCSSRDMAGGAFVATRAMGWANSETTVWVADSSSPQEGDAASEGPSATGLCVCCRDDE